MLESPTIYYEGNGLRYRVSSIHPIVKDQEINRIQPLQSHNQKQKQPPQRSQHKMGASCKNPTQADEQEPTQNNERACCCLGLCNPIDVCRNPGDTEEKGEKGEKEGGKIEPIQFSEGDGDACGRGCVPNFCGRGDGDGKEYELGSAERIFVKTGSTEQKQNIELHTSPRFQPHSQQQTPSQSAPSSPQSPSESSNPQQTSTKKSPSQRQTQTQTPTLIIRSKNSLITSSYYKTNQQIKLTKIQIPFQIIKLSLPTHLITALAAYHPEFMAKYERKDEPRNLGWRMLRNGVYTNLLGNLHGVFIGRDRFYQGFFVAAGESGGYLPDQTGIFISKQQVYKGEFKQGKACGKGKLLIRETRESYEGNWFQGSFISGRYESEDVSYDGEFYNNVPSGLGELRIRKGGIVYKGNFMDGYFQDENAVYQCQKYQYMGAFSSGKKYGKGKLKHFKANLQLEGTWIADKLLEPSIIQKLQPQP